jgi:UDP-N-acetylmuramyl pentapeptide phosphotransferase/UDP-N-acetylglucosamine-1-phosphate transferase
MIEARGRTGRKPSASEKGGSKSGGGRPDKTRKNRYDEPPTWKGASWRAAIAAFVVYVASTLLLKNTTPAKNLILIPIVLVLYMPIIFYTDQFMYRRQQRRKSPR